MSVSVTIWWIMDAWLVVSYCDSVGVFAVEKINPSHSQNPFAYEQLGSVWNNRDSGGAVKVVVIDG